MPQEFARLLDWLEQHPVSHTLLSLAALCLLAWVANWLTKHILLRGLRRLVGLSSLAADPKLTPLGIVARLSNIVPALVLTLGVKAVPALPTPLVTVVENVCSAFIVLTVALAVAGALNLANELYQRRPDAHLRPIKGYIQVLKIVVYALAAILMVASLIDRSPLILLSGLGAMAAVLMLIFQDTLLSLVASVQLGSNDMVRVGDWIEMPQLNADGDVIDIALHTITVQNFDKTITTIPTKKLVTDSFKNWRGMEEAGGRRIKRALYLDQHSVHFLDTAALARLERFGLLDDYLAGKRAELERWNTQVAQAHPEEVNARRLTNLGTFRAYIERYLRSHPGIHQGMTLLVRQLAPGPQGLPLEIYCFTVSTAWGEYEAIQSDVFDHLLAILPEFGLRVFQESSDAMLMAMREGAGRG